MAARARFRAEARRLRVRRCDAAEGARGQRARSLHDAAPGTVLGVSEGGLLVACGQRRARDRDAAARGQARDDRPRLRARAARVRRSVRVCGDANSVTETDPRRLAADVLLPAGGPVVGRGAGRALDNAHLGRRRPRARDPARLRHAGADSARSTTRSRPVRAAARRAIDTVVLVALRLGLFQMAFLDRVPDHAAVITSVDLVARRATSAKGFVNALLRRAQREGLAPPPVLPRSRASASCIPIPTGSCACGSTNARQIGGREAEVERCWPTTRPRPPATARSAAATPRCRRCAVAASRRSRAARNAPRSWSPARCGASTGWPSCRAKPRSWSSRCSTRARRARARRLRRARRQDRGHRRARRRRAAASSPAIPAGTPATASARRCGTPASARASPSTPSRSERFATAGAFDAVLADAPCSGLGTLRQHPEIRWRRTPARPRRTGRRQRSILAAAAAFVRPGGRLVYSTCTIARIENDDVVDAFLAAHPEFSREAAKPAARRRRLLRADGTLRTFPHRHGIDGFFAVRMTRAPAREDSRTSDGLARLRSIASVLAHHFGKKAAGGALDAPRDTRTSRQFLRRTLLQFPPPSRA